VHSALGAARLHLQPVSAEREAVFAELDSRGDRNDGVESSRSLDHADRCTSRFCAKTL